MRSTGIATRSWVGIVLLSLGILLFGTGTAGAGPRIRMAEAETEGGDGNGPFLDLIVREVRVTPIVAHVGDTIRFEMVMEDHGDQVYTTTTIDITANGKEVASKLFKFGWDPEPRKIYRESFQWDTKGASPGEYRIEGEAFVSDDQSPFDNSLKVKEPLVLLPVGAPLPADKADGGTAVAVY
jgi:hypothetical protein